MDTKRAYRFRFYPTPEPERHLARTFGCMRMVDNRMRRLRTDAWYQRQRRVGHHETSALLTALKKDPGHLWRNEVSSVPVQQQSLRHLQVAFANFSAGRARSRRLARKQKGSGNHAKARPKLARVHAKTADSRRDFRHKLSTRLINKNQAIGFGRRACGLSPCRECKSGLHLVRSGCSR
jgi:transposase